jgi:hypothetical protein
MRIFLGVGSMFASGAVVAVLIGWLSSRRSVALSAAGVLVGALVTTFCLGVAVALVADGGEPRLGGVLAIAAFATSAVASVYAVVRGVRFRAM